MKKLIIGGIVVGVIIISSIFSFNQTNEDEYVLYENEKLTIDDFIIKKSPDPTIPAEITVSFQKPNYETKIVNDTPCEYQIINYEIKARFSPPLTWMDIEEAKKYGILNVLNHEQRHFDIQHIYAKIFNTEINAEFANKNIPCVKVDENELDSENHQDAQKLIGPLETSFHNYTLISQDDYEDETTPGNLPDKQENQNVWDKKIDACLSYDGREELKGCIQLNEFKLE